MKKKQSSTAREFIIECLELIREEIEKRDEIYKYGVDLIDYENGYNIVAVNAIVYILSLLNKKTPKSKEQIREEVEWWLWEDVKKEYEIEKRKYNVESAEDFVTFLLEE